MFSKNIWSRMRKVWSMGGLIIVIQFLIHGTPVTAGTPLVYTTVLNANCTALDNITTTYQKISDFGSFTLNSPGSTVEVTFNGRIFVGSFSSSTGAYFELRIDDTATTHGRARAYVRSPEAGARIPVSITGIFTGLSTGSHTVSIWSRTSYGTGTNAEVNAGCWDSDHIVIKEYRTTGLSYLPAISK